jgi:NDP-sugar pyrophosphorylase family protein
MKAMIFAAGLGTRLRPLTNNKPKAMIEIGGIPLLEIAIRKLIHFGVTDIIVNVHHFAEQIEAFIALNQSEWGINITTSDERDLLLDTGGGLKKAKWFFKDDTQPFICCNADILSKIDIGLLYKAHLASGAIATFATQQRETSRYMLFDESNQLRGWLNTKSKEIKISKQGADKLNMYSFSCFQVLSPDVFRYMPREPVFSMIDLYLKLSKRHKVSGYFHPNDLWMDVGRPEAVAEAEKIAW